MRSKFLIALLVFGCLVELGVIAHRFSATVAEPAAQEPPPVPVVKPRPGLSAAARYDSGLPAWPAEGDSQAASVPTVDREPTDGMATNPAVVRANLPAELMPSAELVGQLRQARAAGADLWLLAHVSDTQFQRQLAAWQRQVGSRERYHWEPNQMRREFVEAALGPDAWRRLQLAEWARHQHGLRKYPQLSTAQAEALFDLDQQRQSQTRELQQLSATRQIDAATFRERLRVMQTEHDQQRARLLGEPPPSAPNSSVPVRVVR